MPQYIYLSSCLYISWPAPHLYLITSHCAESTNLGWKAPPKGIGEWGQRDIMPSPGQGSMNSQWQIQRSTFALSQNGHPVA
jgi:hypothetical protein